MEQLPKQVYTSEYRQQAVLMVTRDQMSVAEVSRKTVDVAEDARQLGTRAKEGRHPATNGEAGTPRRVITEEQAELSRLRREVAELRMERDILRKATA